MPRIGHTVRWNNITQKDCDAMGGNINMLPSRGYEEAIDMNPAAEKPAWWYEWSSESDGKPDWREISMVNGTPLLDEEGNPIISGTCPAPSSNARRIGKPTKSILDIIVRRETRRINREIEAAKPKVSITVKTTFNAVPEDILWHMHRRGKTLDTWSLQVLKSQNRDTLKSLPKAGAK